MNKFIRFLKYYSGFFDFPNIPTVVVENGGFIINGEKILLNEIVSVFYRNASFFGDNVRLPVVGASRYEILTKTDILLFYGEHYNLSAFFDKYLEQETYLKSIHIGLIIRWKQKGAKYLPVSARDKWSRNISEKLVTKNVFEKN